VHAHQNLQPGLTRASEGDYFQVTLFGEYSEDTLALVQRLLYNDHDLIQFIFHLGSFDLAPKINSDFNGLLWLGLLVACFNEVTSPGSSLGCPRNSPLASTVDCDISMSALFSGFHDPCK
jgi:hypothetical protein